MPASMPGSSATTASGAPPGRRWVSETDFPLIMDGGCGVITLSYNLAAQRVEHITCNGEA